MVAALVHNWQACLTLLVVLCVLAALIRNYAPDSVLLAGTVTLALVGVITPSEAFAGFSNEGMLTVAALFVVAAGLRETGALDTIGSFVLGTARTERGVMVRLAGSVTGMSAFLNNTPIVAMFIPILTRWCAKHDTSPSRVLLPLSYLTILGGTCTLIGTSTNLVVNGMLTQAQAGNPSHPVELTPFGLFEVTWVGLPYAIIGALYLLTVGYRLIPVRKDFLEQMSQTAREYLVDLRVEPGCSYIGKSLEEAGLRRLRGLFVVEIQRGEQIISPVGPDQRLAAGDVLTFTGEVSTIVDLERVPGLVPIADEGYESQALRQRGRMLCEAVVSATSPVIAKTIRDSNFRAVYNAAVIAVHRGGERLQGRVGDIVLRAGDTLLLQAGPHFAAAHRNDPDFYLVSGIEDYRPVRHDKAGVSIALLAILVALMATQVLSIVVAAFVVAGLMILTRCIPVSAARQSLDWQTLITIGASFGLGKALENSGLVHFVARHVVDEMGSWGPIAMLAGIYLLTSIVTEIITNNAAAVLMFPFAVAIANEASVSPRPFVLAVMFAASASFMTPIGYQTNLMVYGPGGYRFTDFFRVGMPLNLILWVSAMILIPFFFPL
ncbi:MAG: SLC13 family permease [Candidatus Hydrogenedentes bacterium]|nr:SLC13 family permease [Candidatus Hydrogenedentota bacterium]